MLSRVITGLNFSPVSLESTYKVSDVNQHHKSLYIGASNCGLVGLLPMFPPLSDAPVPYFSRLGRRRCERRRRKKRRNRQKRRQ